MPAGLNGPARELPAPALTRPSAVLLDRDGTLNVKADEDDYVTAPDAFVLLPGAVRAVRRLNDAGIPVFVVTNQRGVARGRMTEADLDAIHAVMTRELAAGGAHVDGIYACVHDKDACDCRKPRPGLGRRIAVDHPELDIADAVVVGDADSDIGLAHALRCASIRIGDRATAPPAQWEPTTWTRDVDTAVTLLLAAEARRAS
ncbi:MAG TPA: HAD family hydrolase [Mycobacteriales bacterium]|nr:HAD family hydrolase [Mycobacteriales bacterium]